MLFEQNLAQCMEFESEMDQFRNEFSDLLESNLVGVTSLDGLSPSHSCDSGVDVLLDEVLDVGTISHEPLWFDKVSLSSGDFISDNARCQKQVGLNEEIASKVKREEDIVPRHWLDDLPTLVQIDHCYTSKEMIKATDNGSFESSKSSQDKEGIRQEVCNGSFTQKHQTNNANESVNKESERCNNKNAVMARLNRQRKKRYVDNLESEVGLLRKENKVFSSENKELRRKVQKYKDEMAYLKCVLANQSMLSSVIKAVSSVPGINLSGTVIETEEGSEEENLCWNVVKSPKSNGQTSSSSKSVPREASGLRKRQICGRQDSLPRKQNKKEGSSDASGGICLHVNKENVSIEYCYHCSKHAAKVGTETQDN